jgi:hypothetical protein
VLRGTPQASDNATASTSRDAVPSDLLADFWGWAADLNECILASSLMILDLFALDERFERAFDGYET